jgi:hypothetical protein
VRRTPPPEFQSIFGVRDPRETVRFAGLEMTPLTRVFGSMPWGFSIRHEPHPDAEQCLAAFDARVNDPRAVRSFLKRYRRLLERICAEPDRPLEELVPGRSRLVPRLLQRR